MPAKDPALTLQYLDTLLRYGNFTKAAQQLYISQTYLTQLVKRKERELNVELINRHSAHLQLTEAGKLYYQYLEKINQEKVDFHQKLTQYNNNNEVTIKVGVLPSMGSFILPLFVPNFMQDYPNVTLTLYEGLPSISEKKVQNGEIDFYVGQSPETVSPNLKTITTGHEQYFILIPSSSKFYDERFKLIDPRSLSLPELLAEPLVLSKTGSAIRHQVDGLLQKNKVKPDIRLESQNIELIAGMAAVGLGTTIIPQSVVSHLTNGKYNLYPLEEADLTLRYFIAYPVQKELSQIEQTFVDTFATISQRTQQIEK